MSGTVLRPFYERAFNRSRRAFNAAVLNTAARLRSTSIDNLIVSLTSFPARVDKVHLVIRSLLNQTLKRTRLDNTTNWAVVTLGIALSVTFSNQQASPLPLLFAGVLCIIFLITEARRYRYFNVWRARACWMEKNFYAPMLRGEGVGPDADWPQVLARDYVEPRHHITFARAVGRRLRRN